MQHARAVGYVWGRALRATAIGLGLLASIAWLAGPAPAADVTWKVELGFSNAAKQGAWTPVFVDVANEGESQTGRVVVPIQMNAAGYTRRYVDYVLPVDLPRHAKKRYALYVPLVQSGQPEQITLDLSRYRAKLDNPGGQNMRVVRNNDLLIVVIGGESGFLSFLSGKRGLGITISADRSQNQQQYGPYGPTNFVASESEAQVGRLDWTGLPDSWIGWDGVDAVVLGDAAFSGLSSQALEALRTWVQLGGTLIIPGGTLAPSVAASAIADLLPADISGTTTLPDLSTLSAWAGARVEQQPVLIAQLSLRSDAQVLCGTVSQPLIVSRRAGAGRVVMAAFDFTAPPLKYWDGQEAMWSSLLTGTLRPPSRVAPRETGSWGGPWGGPMQGLAAAAATMPEAELPSMGLIVGFLLAFIVVLVPLNYSVLNRLDRRELAWLTTPAIVVVFTFGAYGLGYAMRGGTIVLNRLGVIEAAAGAPAGRGHGYLGLFSPARTSYDIALDPPASGARDLAQADQHVTGRLSVLAGAQQRITNAGMNMWTTRPFGVEYAVDLHQGVTGNLEYDGKTITGRIHNGTRMTLQNSRIVVGARSGKAANIAAGQDETLTYAEKTARKVTNNPYFSNPRGNAPPSLEELGLAALFGDPSQGGWGNPYMPSGMTGVGQASSPVVFVATLDSSHVPATLARRKPQVKDATILLIDLPIRLARGHFVAVPRWMIPWRITASSGNFSYNPWGNGFQIIQGSITSDFQVPTEGRPAQTNALNLMLNTSNPGGPTPATAAVSAYDFTKHRWETVLQPSGAASGAGGGMGMRGGGGMGGPGGPVATPISLPHPQDFLSPDGRVRVKVEASSGAVQVDALALEATVMVQ